MPLVETRAGTGQDVEIDAEDDDDDGKQLEVTFVQGYQELVLEALIEDPELEIETKC
jgi:hypothetical protein